MFRQYIINTSIQLYPLMVSLVQSLAGASCLTCRQVAGYRGYMFGTERLSTGFFASFLTKKRVQKLRGWECPPSFNCVTLQSQPKEGTR